MKDFLKKIGIFSLIAVLYLSSTGLFYYVHTCLHSGKSTIEWLGVHDESDDHHLDEMASCCAKKASCEMADEVGDCCNHTFKFQKAELVSVQPLVKVFPDFPIVYYAIVNEPIWLVQSVFEQINIIDGGTNLDKLRHRLSKSSLETRIALRSFIC